MIVFLLGFAILTAIVLGTILFFHLLRKENEK